MAKATSECPLSKRVFVLLSVPKVSAILNVVSEACVRYDEQILTFVSSALLVGIFGGDCV